MDEYVVVAEEISKSYQMGFGTVTALKEVSLKIKRGELLAIMGPSGSGKSTLMHLLGCLDKASSGHYYLQGEDISLLDDNALSLLRATYIGFVFQSFHLIPQLTVLENVEIPFLYRPNPSSHHAAIVTALERVGLGHRLHHLPRELSGGEMQRVAIARALAINPLLILADEPTGNLDYETGRSILALFEELHQQGVTIILVTHDPNVGKHCQRIINMRDGKIV
jgi:putative ABC transport system ATP-binding protein